LFEFCSKNQTNFISTQYDKYFFVQFIWLLILIRKLIRNYKINKIKKEKKKQFLYHVPFIKSGTFSKDRCILTGISGFGISARLLFILCK